MASYNRVVVMGNLTRDIELKYTAGGTAVTEISLAINEKRKIGNEWKDEVVFCEVTLWGRTAEVAHEYLGKGAPILIEGRLKLDTWTDKTTGKKRSRLGITGERMQMLGGGKKQGSGSAQQRQAAPVDDDAPPPSEEAPPPTDDDEVPF